MGVWDPSQAGLEGQYSAGGRWGGKGLLHKVLDYRALAHRLIMSV